MDQKISHYRRTARYIHWPTTLAIEEAYLLVDLGDDEGSEGSTRIPG
jgi:cytochrome b561